MDILKQEPKNQFQYLKPTSLYRTIIFIQLIMIIVVFYKFSVNCDNKLTTIKTVVKDKYVYTADYNKAVRQWTDEIYRIGIKHGSSKFYNHDYQTIYGIHLGPLKNRHVDLFEIGIGCGMRYGAGKSILTWREYLPDVRLSMLEYNEKCAQEYRSQIDKLFIGDQTNMSLLEEVVRNGPYDIVIDDGAHTRNQQIRSLIGLWPSVKTGGGVYVIEDMHYNYDNEKNKDSPETSFVMLTKIMHFLVFQKKASLNPTMLKTKISFGIDKIRDIANTVSSVNCYKMACVLVKK